VYPMAHVASLSQTGSFQPCIKSRPLTQSPPFGSCHECLLDRHVGLAVQTSMFSQLRKGARSSRHRYRSALYQCRTGLFIPLRHVLRGLGQKQVGRVTTFSSSEERCPKQSWAVAKQLPLAYILRLADTGEDQMPTRPAKAGALWKPMTCDGCMLMDTLLSTAED